MITPVPPSPITLLPKTPETGTSLKLANLFPSEDPVDDPTFNVVEWINKKFPKKEDLVKLDEEIELTKKKITKVEEEIISAVSQQNKAGEKGEEELQKAKESISRLFSRIREMRGKAIKSQKMVQEICKDIRQLDCAKQNLTTTRSALTRLHEIVTETKKLKLHTERRQYKEVEETLNHVNRILNRFEGYMHLPKLARLKEGADTIKKSLRDQIFSEFAKLEAEKLNPIQHENLRNACFVVEALGPQHRKDLIRQFCENQLSNYDKMFPRGAQEAKIENLDERYRLCKQLIQLYNDHYVSIYLLLWHVLDHLVIEFCKKTRESLGRIFAQAQVKKDNKISSTIDFDVYTRALLVTLEFENYLCKEFPEADKLEDDVDPVAATVLVRPEKSTVFKGLITKVFYEYIYIFVQHQEMHMSAEFDIYLTGDKYLNGDTKGDNDSKKCSVLESSRQLVRLFGSLRNDIRKLSQGRIYYECCLLFRTYLEKYAQKLREKLESMERNNKIFSVDQLHLVCAILNTADYMRETTKEIEKISQDDIEAEWKELVEFQDVATSFDKIIANHCVPMLVNQITYKLVDGPGPNLRNILTTNWSTWETVGEQSEYITTISKELNDVVGFFRSFVFPQQFTFLCDSVVDAVTRLFEAQLNQLRGLSEVGAEQLLLDAAILKGILAKLPPEPISDRFLKSIKKKMAPIESSLRMVMASKESMVETYKELYSTPNGMQFLQIMDLKGIPKAEQEALLDRYGLPPDDPIRPKFHKSKDFFQELFPQGKKKT